MRLILLTTVLLAALVADAQKMIPVKVGDDISLKIPESFINMSQQDRFAKFASSKVPLAMYTSEQRNVDLGINDNNMQWTKDDTQIVYGFYKASLQNLFDEIEFIQDTITTINGKEFIVFEFQSVVKDDNTFSSKKGLRNYTYIQYTSYNDQVLLFNFGCKARFKGEWEDVAKEIMQSVKVK